MIGAVIENIIGGYLHPRASVRRLLSSGHGIDAAVLMLILAFLVREMMVLITPGALPEGTVLSFGQIIFDVIPTLLAFALAATLICYVGRAFGGTGSFTDSALALAWYEIVTSLIFPLMQVSMVRVLEAFKQAGAEMEAGGTIGPVEVPGGAALVVVVGAGISLWLLAAYIAEVHGFKRTVTVFVAVLTLSMLVFSLYGAMISRMVPA